jgi:hypothetical protein
VVLKYVPGPWESQNPFKRSKLGKGHLPWTLSVPAHVKNTRLSLFFTWIFLRVVLKESNLREKVIISQKVSLLSACYKVKDILNSILSFNVIHCRHTSGSTCVTTTPRWKQSKHVLAACCTMTNKALFLWYSLFFLLAPTKQ